MTPPDDASLIAAIARQDRGALDDLVERHQARVYRYLLASGAAPDDAEDALQETFIAVWRSAAGYSGGTSARAWLLTIARNAMLRARRLKVGEPAEHEPLERLGAACGWGGSDTLDDLVRRDLLERTLSALGPEDREILVLRDLEGFSGEEVAELVKLSIPAMKSRLHRARLRFMANLREVARA